jgi:superfamily II DNA/RNA helicase
MMFSATLAPRIQQLGMRVMHEGGKHVHRIEIDSPHDKHVNITQKLYWADHPKHKRALLDHCLRDTEINQAIVFASTQIECESLAEDLQQEGFVAVSLHGALSQSVRNRRLMALRDGRVQILVATDVAARGIDVPTITHVFNYGLPMKAEDYTHRIGRTGRAGRAGLAVTFAEPRDRRRIMDVEAHTKHRIPVSTIAGLEPSVRSPLDMQKPRGKGGYGKPAGRHAAPRAGFAQPRGSDRDNAQVRGFGNKRPATNPRAGADAAPASHKKHQRRPFVA